MNDEQVEELITKAVVIALQGYDDGQLSDESHWRVGREIAKSVMAGREP